MGAERESSRRTSAKSVDRKISRTDAAAAPAFVRTTSVESTRTTTRHTMLRRFGAFTLALVKVSPLPRPSTTA